MSITVYTCILGGYDNLRPPAVVEPGVRYVCFSDEPRQCEPWEIQPAPRMYGNASRDSRIPKILAHLCVDSEYSIWHDGCLVTAMKPSEMIGAHLADADLALYRHPRPSVYAELEYCRKTGIGYGDAMVAQVERYRAHGLGNEYYCGGAILRRHTDIVTLFNEGWWREYLAGCMRDQLALAFTRYSVGLKVNIIEADLLTDSQRFHFNFHAAWPHLGANPSFADLRERQAARWLKLCELCV